MSDTKISDKEYIANTYNRFDLEIVKGKGEFVWDENGKEYIDLSTGIAVNAFGHADEQIINAATEQMKNFFHTSNLYYTNPCVTLAKLLTQKTGMKKVFFSNSGAEANECAIKAAREWAFVNKGEEYYNIITLKNSFHGRTITTLSATGQDVFHEKFLPLTQGFLYAEPNCAEDMEKLLKENKCAAIMIETVQGEGGVIPLDEDYVKSLIKLSQKYNVLIICDEVQTGNGRTGKLYGYMHYDFVPDIVSTAKGLGGGLPIGATMLGEKVKDVYQPGSHGSTFGGNPVCCAAAVNVISRIDDELLEDVCKKSEYIKKELSCAEGVVSVTGRGFMLGVETKKNASDVVKKCMELGVLVITAKTKVRILPPLNICQQSLEKAVKIIKKAIAEA